MIRFKWFLFDFFYLFFETKIYAKLFIPIMYLFFNINMLWHYMYICLCVYMYNNNKQPCASSSSSHSLAFHILTIWFQLYWLHIIITNLWPIMMNHIQYYISNTDLVPQRNQQKKNPLKSIAKRNRYEKNNKKNTK